MPTTTAHGLVKMASDLEPADLYGTNTRLADSAEAAFAALDPTAWTAPTFTNSWVDFGSGLQVAQYRKVGDEVELRGCIKTGTIGTAAFTLPSGFRPPASIAPAVDSNGGHGRVSIASTGTVTPDIGNTASVRLDGIKFSVTA